MNTKNYYNKMTYCRFDENHFLLYLNEAAAEITESQSETPVQGFSYTGPYDDGGTMIEATDATYDAFVAGLLRAEYSANRVEAISLNRINALADPTIERADEFIAEFDALEAFRVSCKATAKAVLGL